MNPAALIALTTGTQSESLDLCRALTSPTVCTFLSRRAVLVRYVPKGPGSPLSLSSGCVSIRMVRNESCGRMKGGGAREEVQTVGIPTSTCAAGDTCFGLSSSASSITRGSNGRGHTVGQAGHTGVQVVRSVGARWCTAHDRSAQQGGLTLRQGKGQKNEVSVRDFFRAKGAV